MDTLHMMRIEITRECLESATPKVVEVYFADAGVRLTRQVQESVEYAAALADGTLDGLVFEVRAGIRLKRG